MIALDLYDGKVATNRDDAGKFMQAVQADRAGAIIDGAITLVGSGARIGTVGWCFGGGWSLQASLLADQQAEACVIYYGMPVQEVDRLKTLKTPVLGIFAEQDGWITPEVVKTFEENMEKAGKELTVKMYDANHGFSNPSNPAYAEAASKDAWDHTLAFFKRHLKE